jgi:hypothetical protein
MNDLPMGRPSGSGSMPQAHGQPGYPPNTDRPNVNMSERPASPSLKRGIDRRPMGLGSVIGFFFGLMFVFLLAAAVAQYAVRGDRQTRDGTASAPAAGQAPRAPAVTLDQTPGKPSPPADGNPAASVTPNATTP